MTRWEYQTVKFDVAGFFGPAVRRERLDEPLRGHGRTSEIVAVLERSR